MVRCSVLRQYNPDLEPDLDSKSYSSALRDRIKYSDGNCGWRYYHNFLIHSNISYSIVKA